jgi:hypothetical protein
MIQDPKTYQQTLIRAYNNISNMDFLDSSGNITPLGDICSRFSIYDIKIAKMCICGYYMGCLQHCIILAAILHNVMSFEDIFIKPLDMDEDREIAKAYTDKIKSMCNPHGDHITLLSIFYEWVNSPDRKEFANYYGLQLKILNNIERSYDEIQSTMEKLSEDIKNLNLFNVPDGILAWGGGINNSANITNIRMEMAGGENQSYIGYSSSSDSSSDDSSYSGDSRYSEYINIPYEINNENIPNIIGGYNTNFRLSSENIQKFINEAGSSSHFQNTSSNNGVFDRISQNGGRISNNNYGYQQRYNYSQISRKVSGNANRKNKIINSLSKKRKTRINNISYSIKNQFGGDTQKLNEDKKNAEADKKKADEDKKKADEDKKKADEDKKKAEADKKKAEADKKKAEADKKKAEADKKKANEDANIIKAKRYEKIMNLISLKNIKIRNLQPTMYSDIDKILACLFFGFSNNIASYTGIGKKYNVKFSPLKGSISKSSYDFLGTIPNLVVYHEFTVMKNIGGGEDEKLNLISQINSDHIGMFQNINEIMKQL